MTSESHRRLHACCASAGRTFASPGTSRKYERSRPFVVTHLALDIKPSFEEKSVSGVARLHFERRAPLGASLDLDARALDVGSVQLDSVLLTAGEGYTYDGETIVIPISAGTDSGVVEVVYSATPQAGLYFLEPDSQVPHRPKQLWSQCQDEDGRFWFPCQDKPHVKMTSEIRVQVPAGMRALSNGTLLDWPLTADEPGYYHYRFDSPHPAYLITLVVGTFDEWTEEVELPSGRQVTLKYWVPPGQIEAGKRAFRGTAAMMRLLSQKTGVEYPWPTYTQVVVSDFIFGGMENTTATTMYEHILLDERAALDVESDDLVVHELGHQWFGDLVTCRDWSHAWLNEGFATFCEHLEKEARLGADEYVGSLLTDLDQYLAEAEGEYERPIVCRDYEEPIDLFDRHLYQKGGLVLHMLRRKLGDDLFWKGVHSYLTTHRFGIVETTDFMRAMEQASGLSLERFFDEWVYRAGHPTLSAKISYSDGLLEVVWTQSHSSGSTQPMELEITVQAGPEGSLQVERRTMTSLQETITLRVPRRPAIVVLNHELHAVLPLKVEGPEDILLSTLAEAPTAYGRLQAGEALRKRHSPRTIQAFRARLEDEAESWMVRSLAAECLGQLRGQVAELALEKNAQTAHPKVRRAVALALGQIGASRSTEILTALLDDPSYLVSAAAARSLGKVRPADAQTRLMPLLDRPSWADAVSAGAVDGLAALPGTEQIPVLIAQTAYGRPQRARRAAVAALGRIGEGRAVRESLEGLLRDRDPHMRTAAVRALGQLGDAKSKAALAELLDREWDGRVQRPLKLVLAGLAKDKREGVRETQRDLDSLKAELRTLQTRLGSIEQSQKKAKTKAKAEKRRKKGRE